MDTKGLKSPKGFKIFKALNTPCGIENKCDVRILDTGCPPVMGCKQFGNGTDYCDKLRPEYPSECSDDCDRHGTYDNSYHRDPKLYCSVSNNVDGSYQTAVFKMYTETCLFGGCTI